MAVDTTEQQDESVYITPTTPENCTAAEHNEHDRVTILHDLLK